MTLLLSESEVKSILTMPLALEAVENSFQRLADGSALLHSRARLHTPGKSYLHYMAAADATSGYMGLKIYTSSKDGLRFLILLFSVESGDLVAQIEADYVGQMRTGAASGVATKLLARANAKTVGIIGTGLQARTQLEAISHARKIENVRAFSRDPQRRETFASEMSTILKIPVVAVPTAEQAVRACDVITADSREQSKLESGDLIQMYGDDQRRWTNVINFAEIVSGKTPGRTNDQQITLFKSNGIAIEDIVVAGRIYEIAKEKRMGRQLTLWEKSEQSRDARAV